MRRAAGQKRRGPSGSAVTSAASAGLRYVTDDRPGIRREIGALGFRYTSADGRPVRSPADLKRIRALAIPPAWNNVWICLDPKGHVQATGHRFHREGLSHMGGDRTRGDKLTRAMPAAVKRVALKLRRDEVAALQILKCMRSPAHRRKAA
jgi:hypothetical protein